MKCVVQRVKRARVTVKGEVAGEIGKGLLVFVGVARGDGPEEVDYTARKIAGLRVFVGDGVDESKKMNLSVGEVGGEAGGAVLLVSQFTLLGDTRKGRRPSFVGAEDPERARVLVGELAKRLRSEGLRVAEGVFGAMMDVELVNDGPVTLIIESP